MAFGLANGLSFLVTGGTLFSFGELNSRFGSFFEVAGDDDNVVEGDGAAGIVVAVEVPAVGVVVVAQAAVRFGGTNLGLRRRGGIGFSICETYIE